MNSVTLAALMDELEKIGAVPKISLPALGKPASLVSPAKVTTKSGTLKPNTGFTNYSNVNTQGGGVATSTAASPPPPPVVA